MARKPTLLVLLVAIAGLAAMGFAGERDQPRVEAVVDTSYSQPQPVTITGYHGHAMEPFVSRDGMLLFFNNRNDPKDQTDLHVARRVDDRSFVYLGPLSGANSTSLDGVASLDREGRIYFVSNRDYDSTGNTLWTGRFAGGVVSDVARLAADFTPRRLLRLNIDLEISADGNTLYVAENRSDLFRAMPATSDLAMARRSGNLFQRLPQSDQLMAAVNSKALEFAPATTADELTLYFTRLDVRRLRRKLPDAFQIMVSVRPDRSAPWSAPRRIAAFSGHVEAPSVTADGCSVYVHRNDSGVFRILVSRMQGCGA